MAFLVSTRTISLRYLGEEGSREETLIILTSDHGEEFQEHGSLLHGRTYYQEVIAIPLLLNGPGVPAGLTVQEPVHLVDVAPTLLRLLGLPVEQQPMHAIGATGNGAGELDNPVCFEVPSDYEITLHGKKIIGSAQARRKGGVLQHGSLPLFGDIARITEILRYPSRERRQQAAERVRARAATLEEGLGRRVTFGEASEAFMRGFAETLSIEFVEGELTEKEGAAVERWLAERYGAPAWTQRA